MPTKTTKKTTKTICYTGIGAKPTGNHSESEFMNIMNREYRKECAEYMQSPKCNACRRLTRRAVSQNRKTLKSILIGKKVKKTPMDSIEIIRCKKCKMLGKKCNLSEYMDFSGAEKGPCVKTQI